MVGKIIRDYMEGGAKKLTVPGFGTFMRRDGGEGVRGGIIFVDLLRTDDKVLSEMVEDAGGYSEVEAMVLIDRFIFETKNAIEHHGRATIDGFGTMTLDHKGVYQFDHSPRRRPPVGERATQERLFAAETGVKTKMEESRVEKSAPTKTAPRREPENRPEGRPSQRQHHYPQAARPRRQDPQGSRKPQRPHRSHGSQLSRSDTFVVIAIIAALVALVAMLFGMYAGNMPFLSK